MKSHTFKVAIIEFPDKEWKHNELATAVKSTRVCAGPAEFKSYEKCLRTYRCTSQQNNTSWLIKFYVRNGIKQDPLDVITDVSGMDVLLLHPRDENELKIFVRESKNFPGKCILIKDPAIKTDEVKEIDNFPYIYTPHKDRMWLAGQYINVPYAAFEASNLAEEISLILNLETFMESKAQTGLKAHSPVCSPSISEKPLTDLNEEKRNTKPLQVSQNRFSFLHEWKEGYDLCIKDIGLMPLASSLCKEFITRLGLK